ncbi:MAG: preprotein translocase subunit SecD, partial [Actinomycetota bacterium]
PDATTTTLPGTTTSSSPSTSLPGTSDSVEDGAGIISGGPGASRVVSTATTITATTVPETTAPETTVPETSSTEPIVVTTENPLADLGLGDDPNDPTQTVLLFDKSGIAYVVGPAGASGKVFKNDAQPDVQTGQWAVVVGLRSGVDGDQLWNRLAAACFNKTPQCPTGQLAMVLDGTVISAPTVNEPEFTGGTVQISGSFTADEARELAKILEFGAVPVRFSAPSAQTVSATLGQDSLDAAIVSGLVGVALVLLFLIFYYRRLAVVVIGGLAVSGMLQWSTISWLSQRNGLALSLAGVTGIIVSIGVTVDSYVVFFEKLKDDVLAGRTLRNSATRSFESAWRTILAADTVSLLGALVLWFLTVGSVRGFAFFLGLSTLCDMIVAYFFTRPTVILLARSKFMNTGKMFGVSARKVLGSESTVAGGAQS